MTFDFPTGITEFYDSHGVAYHPDTNGQITVIDERLFRELILSGFMPSIIEVNVLKSTDTDLGSSDILYPSQKAVKDYVDTHLVCLNYGAPAANVANRFVVSTDMKVGAYTVANSSPGDSLPHNISVTVTKADAFDTPGTITITGTDYNNAVITEIVTPIDGTAYSVKTFKTVTGISGAAWVAVGGADQITIGFAGLIGLPAIIAAAADLLMATHGTGVLNAPTVAVGAAISQCTIDLSTDGDGAKRLRLLYQS
jgi:hypothetical protein